MIMVTLGLQHSNDQGLHCFAIIAASVGCITLQENTII